MRNRIGNQNLFSKAFSKYGIVLMLLLLMAIVTILIPQFIAIQNLVGILEQCAIYGIMALGAAIIIISGGIDLSAGSIVAFAAVVGACFGQDSNFQFRIIPGLPDFGMVVPILVSLLAGAFCGFVNGLLISKAKLFPFIATLGTYTMVRGFALVITNGQPVTHLIKVYNVIGGKLFGSLPMPVLIFFVTIIVCSIVLNHTRFGSNIFAIGGNLLAANVTGIHIPRTLTGIYTFAGALYGLAGLVYAGRVLSVNPGAASGYELTAIAAAIIGGVSPVGGKGTIWGAVIGALILGVIRNSLTLLAVDPYFQQIAEGLIIIIAVIFAMRRKKS